MSPLLKRRATVIGVFAPPSRITTVFTITEPSVHSICTVRMARFTASSIASPLLPAVTSATVPQPASATVAPVATIATAKIHFFMCCSIFQDTIVQVPGTIAHAGRRFNPVAAVCFWLASRPRFGP